MLHENYRTLNNIIKLCNWIIKRLLEGMQIRLAFSFFQPRDMAAGALSVLSGFILTSRMVSYLITFLISSIIFLSTFNCIFCVIRFNFQMKRISHLNPIISQFDTVIFYFFKNNVISLANLIQQYQIMSFGYLTPV